MNKQKIFVTYFWCQENFLPPYMYMQMYFFYFPVGKLLYGHHNGKEF